VSQIVLSIRLWNYVHTPSPNPHVCLYNWVTASCSGLVYQPRGFLSVTVPPSPCNSAFTMLFAEGSGNMSQTSSAPPDVPSLQLPLTDLPTAATTLPKVMRKVSRLRRLSPSCRPDFPFIAFCDVVVFLDFMLIQCPYRVFFASPADILSLIPSEPFLLHALFFFPVFHFRLFFSSSRGSGLSLTMSLLMFEYLICCLTLHSFHWKQHVLHSIVCSTERNIIACHESIELASSSQSLTTTGLSRRQSRANVCRLYSERFTFCRPFPAELI